MNRNDIVAVSVAALKVRKKSNFATQPPALDSYQVRRKTNRMQKGTIASVTDRGFGFIKVEGQQKDVFFHSQELVGVAFDELRVGDMVEFEIEQSDKGPKAVKVSKVS
ncbi:MAG: cold shock domain-containing protein [Minisyncoccia bacterium]